MNREDVRLYVFDWHGTIGKNKQKTNELIKVLKNLKGNAPYYEALKQVDKSIDDVLPGFGSLLDLILSAHENVKFAVASMLETPAFMLGALQWAFEKMGVSNRNPFSKTNVISNIVWYTYKKDRGLTGGMETGKNIFIMALKERMELQDLQPTEIMLIDDNQTNITAAKQAGYQTYTVDSQHGFNGFIMCHIDSCVRPVKYRCTHCPQLFCDIHAAAFQ